MEAAGQQVIYRQLNDAEFLREAGRKVLEEAAELDPQNPDIDEVIDIIHAAEALASAQGITSYELERMKAERNEQKGIFLTRTYVESVALSDDDPWVEHYASEPRRFKEVAD